MEEDVDRDQFKEGQIMPNVLPIPLTNFHSCRLCHVSGLLLQLARIHVRLQCASERLYERLYLADGPAAHSGHVRVPTAPAEDG